jgi:hypothetical protein
MVKAVHRAHNDRGSALRQAFASPPAPNTSTNHWLRGFTPHRIMIGNESRRAINRRFREFPQLMKR